MKLKDEVAIVTGSTTGIGVAIAQLTAAEGAKVVVTGRRESGGSVAEDIRKEGARQSLSKADISVERSRSASWTRRPKQFGHPTVLINNAAPTDLVGPGNLDGRLTDVDTDEFDQILHVGLYGAYWTCYHTIPHMQAAGHGSIVNISSAAGIKACPAGLCICRRQGRIAGPDSLRCRRLRV